MLPTPWLLGHTAPPTSLALSPDGRLLASADDDGFVYLWDLERRRAVALVRQTRQPRWRPWPRDEASSNPRTPGDGPPRQATRCASGVDGLAWTSDGALCVATWWDGVEVYRNGEVMRLPRCRGPIAADGRELWVWASNATLRRLELAHGGYTAEVRLRPPPVRDAGRPAGIDPVTRRVRQESDDGARVWDLDTGRIVEGEAIPAPSSRSLALARLIEATEGSPPRSVTEGGDRVVLGDERGRIRVVPYGDLRHGFTLPSVTAEVVSVAFVDERTVVSAHADGVVRRWCLRTGELRLARRSPWGAPMGVDGRVAVSGEAGAAWVWDPTTGAVQARIDLGDATPRHVAVAGERVAIGAFGTVRAGGFVVVARGNLVEREERGLRGSLRVALGPAGQLAYASGGDPAVVVDGRRVEVGAPPVSLAFTPCGRYLVSGGLGYTADVVALATCERFLSIRAHRDCIRVAVSRTGAIAMATTYDPVLAVWDPRVDLVRPLRGHDGSLRCVAFSPSGRLLASGAQDGAVCVWRGTRRVARFQVLPGGEAWASMRGATPWRASATSCTG